MIIVPIQYFGLGDIIFEQTLVRKIANGSAILWPVAPQFKDGLQQAYPDITFADRTKMDIDYNRQDDYVQNDMRCLPFRWADAILQVPYTQCMSSKYQLYNQDYRTWKEQAMWHRDSDKEDELFKSFGCDKGEYVFTNVFFGSESQLRISVPMQESWNLPLIEMRTIPRFSLFDWAKVLENANEIHTVSTSILFLLEMLDLKAKEVHLYCRKPIEHNFDNIEYLLERHNYKLHL